VHIIQVFVFHVVRTVISEHICNGFLLMYMHFKKSVVLLVLIFMM